jgi:hypothetical protein
VILVERECDRINQPEGLRVVPDELVDARFRFYLIDVLELVEVPLLPDVHNGPALLGTKPYTDSKKSSRVAANEVFIAPC